MQALKLCLSANQYTLCSLVIKGQIPKPQAIERLKIYSSLIRLAIWSGRALSLGTTVTSSDNFCAGFKSLSFNQPVYSLLAANKGTNPEAAVSTAIENVYTYNTFFYPEVFCHENQRGGRNFPSVWNI